MSVCPNLLSSNKVSCLPGTAISNPGMRREVQKECFLTTLPRIFMCGYEEEKQRDKNKNVLENILWGIVTNLWYAQQDVKHTG